MHFGHDLLSLFPLLLLLGHLSLFSLAPARFLALLSLVRFLGLFSLFLWLPSSAVLLGASGTYQPVEGEALKPPAPGLEPLT